ncbi:MAG TPA: hypothetical protein VK401_04205 [Propionibacteriaceae bacterium]|nr:hypothetical protein [Propionibacteriaceae bacterium]
MTTTTPVTAWIRIGLVALPLYGLIAGYTTRKPQPDQVTDPEGWARFVSSPSYLVEHIASNVLGALLVIFGTLALGAFLAGHRTPRLALWGMVWRLPKWAGGLWIAATVVFYVLGAALGMATTNASLITQPIGGLLLAISGGWIAGAVLRRRSARSA